MPPTDTDEEYGTEWFKKRAIHSISKISDSKWDYSDSLLLWQPETENNYEMIQNEDAPYFRAITQPEKKFLSTIVNDLVSELPDNFEFMDLGPGTAGKEKIIFERLRLLGKHFTYYPVDIVSKYLKSAVESAESLGIKTQPVHAPFEELPYKMPPTKNFRFVSLGLTYSNYHPNDILRLLKSLIGNHGAAFIDCQIREKVNMSELVSIYQHDVTTIPQSKIRLLGLDPESDIKNYDCNDAIEFWVTLKNTNKALSDLGVQPGHKLLIFQSLRPSLRNFKANINEQFASYKLLDAGGPFVGAMLK